MKASVVDNHVHLFRAEHRPALLRDLAAAGVDQFCLLVTGRDKSDPQGEQFRLAAELQRDLPQQVFVFGGLDFRGLFDFKRQAPDVPFDIQTRRLIETGYDGLKLLCGKPDHRKSIGVPLDGPVFEPMLDLLEREQFPLLWHIADPAEFWSQHTVPLWARNRGWWYDDETPSKSQIDSEFARLLKRHPTLKLIVPHFAFRSDQLDEARQLLTDHPNLMLDLAPGIEMYHYFTQAHAAARQFFIDFAHRILFGSDIGMPCGWHPNRPGFVLDFLRLRDWMLPPADPCFQPDERGSVLGLGLPEPALQAICRDNFLHYVGRFPRQIETKSSWSSH
jgi:predicted TIM-barrel fold metal-dependent hydrolase